MRKKIECSTIGCSNKFLLTYSSTSELYEPRFCEYCRKNNSQKALQIQYELEKDIKDILIEAAKDFRSASMISDYLGVSFVTIYNWITKYFGMGFQEFKRNYICRSQNCHIIDINKSSYSRSDYILKKIQKQRYCACINALEPGLIMTNAPPEVISNILRGSPKIEKISDDFFRIAPNPVLGIGRTPFRTEFPESLLESA